MAGENKLLALRRELIADDWEEKAAGHQEGAWSTGYLNLLCILLSALWFSFVHELFSHIWQFIEFLNDQMDLVGSGMLVKIILRSSVNKGYIKNYS